MSISDTVKFPDIRKELMQLEEQDQKEIRGHYKILQAVRSEAEKRRKSDLLAKHCHVRAYRMLEILEEIKVPTIENIGLEGSKTVSLLALHSYLDIMRKVLDKYKTIYKKNPEKIYGQAIPPLTDRIMILEHRMQLFGTNWSMDKDGNFFLIPVKKFAAMNQRRVQYGLEPARKPTILSVGATKYPLGKGKATESDQKELTDEEYEEYSRYHLRSMI